MPEQEEQLDIDGEVQALHTALRLQYRSALHYTLAAGSVVGFETVALGDRMWISAAADLADARRLIEKIVSLGGEPTPEVAPLTVEGDGQHLVDHLIETETECVNAL